MHNKMNDFIAQHYIDNKNNYLRWLSYATGTVQGAEDVIHDAYERALRYHYNFHGDDFDNWMALILKNALRDYMKIERGQNLVELDEFDFKGADCNGVSLLTIKEIEKRIANKQDAHAEVLELYFIKGYSAVEISKFNPFSYHNIYQIVRRFKEELKLKYGERAT